MVYVLYVFCSDIRQSGFGSPGTCPQKEEDEDQAGDATRYVQRNLRLRRAAEAREGGQYRPVFQAAHLGAEQPQGRREGPRQDRARGRLLLRDRTAALELYDTQCAQTGHPVAAHLVNHVQTKSPFLANTVKPFYNDHAWCQQIWSIYIGGLYIVPYNYHKSNIIVLLFYFLEPVQWTELQSTHTVITVKNFVTTTCSKRRPSLRDHYQ